MRSLFSFNLIIPHPAFFQRISLQRFRLPIPLFQATCEIPCWEFSAADFSGLAFQFSAFQFSVLGTPFSGHSLRAFQSFSWHLTEHIEENLKV